jgi:hypothetical protein
MEMMDGVEDYPEGVPPEYGDEMMEGDMEYGEE